MKKFSKKLISIIMAVCIMCSVLTVAFPANASATGAVGAFAVKVATEKLYELGLRGACAISNKLAENVQSDDTAIVVKGFTKLFLMTPVGNSLTNITQMCGDILAELTQIEENMKKYDNAVSSAIDKQNAANAKKLYSDKWSEDVSDVIPSDVNKAYNAYVEYLIMSMVNNYGLPEDSDNYNTLNTFWKNHFSTSGSLREFTDTDVENAYAKLEQAFIAIQGGGNGETAVSNTYNSALVYNKLVNTITELTDNFVYDEMGHISDQYTVVECAAASAYYFFPYSYQQYEFVDAVAKKQIMQAVLLEMTLNEYLAMQGEYLEENKTTENWDTDTQLVYKDNLGNSVYTSYSLCKSGYQSLIENTSNEISNLYSSNIDIDTSAFTGEIQNFTTSFSQYMKAEDAATVELTINGYINKYDYKTTINQTEAGGHEGNYDLGNTVTNSKYISSTLKFNRVMSGDENGEVYYILDTSQFSDSNALNMAMANFHVKRYGMYGGSDALYGDLYLPSTDYLNLIKNMSDGTNTYSVPSSAELSDELNSLMNTPYFSANSQFKLQTYLSEYLPSKNTGDTYILTSNYSNNLNEGFWSACKYATFEVGNLTKATDNTREIVTQTVSLEDVSNTHNYTLILSNNRDVYKQETSVKLDNSIGGNGDIRIVADGNTVSLNETSTIESGKEISIQFKVDDISQFKSLKLVRNNAETTETVLIDENTIQYFETTDDGYYSFDTTMPYSNCTFVLETQSGMDMDENGSYIVDSYDDLCSVALMINSGIDEYVNGSYVLASDIDCKGEDWTEREIIGTSTVQFNGTFDGQGHTISNLNSGADVEGEDSGCIQGLFAVLGEDAVVKNLNFTNATVWSDSTLAEGSAVIAKQNNGTIQNCTVKSSRVQLGNSAYLGGIAGLNNGVIENCSVENTTLMRRWGGSTTRTMGAIAEVNNGTVKNCTASGCSFRNGVPPESNALIATGNTPV